VREFSNVVELSFYLRFEMLSAEDFVVGSIDDLRHGSKGGLDPSGFGQSKLAADVLWSDPAKESGFKENDGRGIGMVFGPEVTEVCNWLVFCLPDT
jgi:serine/threonine-protein phosphatase 5